MTSTFAKPYIFQFVKVVEPASKCLCKLNQPLFINQLFPCFPCFLYRHGRRTRIFNSAWWSHLGPINPAHGFALKSASHQIPSRIDPCRAMRT